MKDIFLSLRNQCLKKKKKKYIYDELISNLELLWIYDTILNSEGWKINCHPGRNTTAAFSTHPVLVIQKEKEIINLFWAGYFQKLIFTIKDIIKKEDNLIIPNKIKRIHVIAKSSFSDSALHIDSNDENAYSIVGFLNPIWNNSDGGGFLLEDEIIQNKPGRFVIFKSNMIHDGIPISKKDLRYWRLLVNIILKD